jgi:MFS family permease
MQMAVTAAFNGVGLALQIPAIHAFVAESVDGANRGTAFGWLAVASKAGTVAGTSIGLLMAPTSFLGLPGWRLAFILLGVVGAAVGASIRAFAAGDASARTCAATSASAKPVRQELQEFAREARAVMRVPSFQVIIAQGLTGSFPWSALMFTAMWLELVGFSHGETAALMTLFKAATSVGALFGGKMGDALARRFPNSGRIVLSQISSGSAIPLAGVLLLALPNDATTPAKHGAALFVLVIMASCNGSATNSPILAEIVPPRAMTTVFALDRTFEAVLASFAPLVVGILAERLYGYKLSSRSAGDSDQAADVTMERHNAKSLAKALFTAISFPMALCCLIYSFLYCTYPKDREMARAEAERDGDEGSDAEDEEESKMKLLPQ